MVDTTPRLALGELQAAQSQKHVTVNDALIQLDAFCDLYLLGQFVDTPPASPSDGDTYITGGAPSGAWSGYAYKIAYCLDGGWRFYTPFNGLRALVSGGDAITVYEGGTWRALDPLAKGPSGTTLDSTGLGIGTTPTEALTVDGLLAGGIGAATTAGVADWNDVTNARSGSGHTLLQQKAPNGPTETVYYAHSFSFEYVTKDGTGDLTQFAIPYSNSLAGGMYFRGRTGGTWTGWYKVYTAQDAGGTLYPDTDNAASLGKSSNRWSTIYAGTGTINTSAADTKTAIRALSDSEIAVAKTLAANVRVFQFCDAVTKKGADAARLHTGMIYEDVVAAFTAQSLDPLRYGIVCRDAMMKRVTGPAPSPADAANGVAATVTEIPDTNEDGSPKYVMGLRYSELAQFVMAGMAARLAALEAK
jgi:hypothetical protein